MSKNLPRQHCNWSRDRDGLGHARQVAVRQGEDGVVPRSEESPVFSPLRRPYHLQTLYLYFEQNFIEIRAMMNSPSESH